jgi:predicted small lipoprotein YifL
MKKLFLISLVFFTTFTVLTACGEKGTGNATEDATAVVDSTANATGVVKDTTVVK